MAASNEGALPNQYQYKMAEMQNLKLLEYWSGVSQKVYFPQGCAESADGVIHQINDIPRTRHKKQRVERLIRQQNKCDGLCCVNLSEKSMLAFRDITNQLISATHGGTQWSSDILDVRTRCYGFMSWHGTSPSEMLRRHGIKFHMFEFDDEVGDGGGGGGGDEKKYENSNLTNDKNKGRSNKGYGRSKHEVSSGDNRGKSVHSGVGNDRAVNDRGGNSLAIEDEERNIKASIILGKDMFTPQLKEAVQEVVDKLKPLLEVKYRKYMDVEQLIALQPNVQPPPSSSSTNQPVSTKSNSNDSSFQTSFENHHFTHLNLHVDQPRYEGFGVVIVTVCISGSATIVLLDEKDEENVKNRDKDAWSFLLSQNQCYALSGNARNKCLHGVLPTSVVSTPMPTSSSSQSVSSSPPSQLVATTLPQQDGPFGKEVKKYGEEESKHHSINNDSSSDSIHVGQGGRVSLNLRFGLHDEEGDISFHNEFERHWSS